MAFNKDGGAILCSQKRTILNLKLLIPSMGGFKMVQGKHLEENYTGYAIIAKELTKREKKTETDTGFSAPSEKVNGYMFR